MTAALRPLVRGAVPVVAVALAIVGAAATSRALTGDRSETPPADVLALPLPDVSRVALESAGPPPARRVELVHNDDGSWSGGSTVSPEVEGLLSDSQERLFPLQGYRALPADTAAPEYGLASPEITLSVQDRQGREHRVLLGAPTFTNGGVYAMRAGEPGRLYLVPRRMMDDLRSLLTGRRVDSPNDLPQKLKEKTPEHDPTSWWLRQSLTTEGGK